MEKHRTDFSQSHKAFLRRCGRIADKLERSYDYNATPTNSNPYRHLGDRPRKIFNNIFLF